jgi:hypothetical protein
MVPFLLNAYNDSDLDGVEDRVDQCPNTPMTELVNLMGCTVEHLLSLHHFSVKGGFSYALDQESRYTFSSFEFDYFYQDFSLQLSSSYYDLESNMVSDEGVNDSYIKFFYTLKPFDNFSLKLGSALALPTYEESKNRVDYLTSISGKYSQNNWNCSMGLGYSISNDVNSSNRLFYHLNFGYTWSDDFYSSIGYYISQSSYEGLNNLESISLYNSYAINKNWFTTLSLTQGLNEATLENSMGVKLGYYW